MHSNQSEHTAEIINDIKRKVRKEHKRKASQFAAIQAEVAQQIPDAPYDDRHKMAVEIMREVNPNDRSGKATPISSLVSHPDRRAATPLEAVQDISSTSISISSSQCGPATDSGVDARCSLEYSSDAAALTGFEADVLSSSSDGWARGSDDSESEETMYAPTVFTPTPQPMAHQAHDLRRNERKHVLRVFTPIKQSMKQNAKKIVSEALQGHKRKVSQFKAAQDAIACHFPGISKEDARKMLVQAMRDINSIKNWIKVPDPRTGKMYYANLVTKETRWQAPPGWPTEPERAASNKIRTKHIETKAEQDISSTTGFEADVASGSSDDYDDSESEQTVFDDQKQNANQGGGGGGVHPQQPVQWNRHQQQQQVQERRMHKTDTSPVGLGADAQSDGMALTGDAPKTQSIAMDEKAKKIILKALKGHKRTVSRIRAVRDAIAQFPAENKEQARKVAAQVMRDINPNFRTGKGIVINPSDAALERIARTGNAPKEVLRVFTPETQSIVYTRNAKRTISKAAKGHKRTVSRLRAIRGAIAQFPGINKEEARKMVAEVMREVNPNYRTGKGIKIVETLSDAVEVPAAEITAQQLSCKKRKCNKIKTKRIRTKGKRKGDVRVSLSESLMKELLQANRTILNDEKEEEEDDMSCCSARAVVSGDIQSEADEFANGHEFARYIESRRKSTVATSKRKSRIFIRTDRDSSSSSSRSSPELPGLSTPMAQLNEKEAYLHSLQETEAELMERMKRLHHEKIRARADRRQIMEMVRDEMRCSEEDTEELKAFEATSILMDLQWLQKEFLGLERRIGDFGGIRQLQTPEVLVAAERQCLGALADLAQYPPSLLSQETRDAIRVCLKAKFSDLDISIALRDVYARLAWKRNSTCFVFSRERGWAYGLIEAIKVDEQNKEWLIVKYAGWRKRIQRFAPAIKPVIFGSKYIAKQDAVDLIAAKLRKVQATRRNEISYDRLMC